MDWTCPAIYPSVHSFYNLFTINGLSAPHVDDRVALNDPPLHKIERSPLLRQFRRSPADMVMAATTTTVLYNSSDQIESDTVISFVGHRIRRATCFTIG